MSVSVKSILKPTDFELQFKSKEKRSIRYKQMPKKERRLQFDELNLMLTQRYSPADRTYGFIKARQTLYLGQREAQPMLDYKEQGLGSDSMPSMLETDSAATIKTKRTTSSSTTSTATPTPTSSTDEERSKSLDAYINERISIWPDSQNAQTIRGASFYMKNDEALSFDEQRRLFDYGEYTATRGTKMSDLLHPPVEISPLTITKVFKNTEEAELRNIKEYCNNRNISIILD